MQLYSLTCPNCSANLNVEDGIDTFYCSHCGYKIVLTGQDAETLKLKTKLAMEKMRNDQANLEWEQKMKEEKEKEERKYRETKFFLIILGILLLVFGVLPMVLPYIL